MDTSEPDVSFTIRLSASGTLRLGARSFELPAIALEHSKYAAQEPWKMRAILTPDDAGRIFDWSWQTKPEEAEIVGRTDGGEEFRIPSAGGFAFVGREFQLDVHEIEFGATEIAMSPAEQLVTIYLTESKLIQHRPTRDVEIGRRYYAEAEPFTWQSPLGPMELERIEQTELARVNGASSSIEIPSVVMRGGVSPPRKDPGRIVSELKEPLSAFLAVLSLLSRSRVSSTRIVVSSTSLEATPPISAEFTRWRSAVVSEKAVSHFPLVSPPELSRSEIDEMARRLLTFDGAEHLITAVYFLTSWMDTRFWEERIVNAFTSLEAVVSGLPTARDPDDAQAGELLDRLRTDLLRHAPAYPPTLIERAGRALESITQRPIAQRVAALVETYAIDTVDLWLPYVGVEKGVRDSYRHRNAIIHRGDLADPRAASAAAYRIHALAERILFAALGGSADSFHGAAYRHLRDMKG